VRGRDRELPTYNNVYKREGEREKDEQPCRYVRVVVVAIVVVVVVVDDDD
jgi:hypothetical protein